MDKNESLASDIDPLQKEILEIEGVETKFKEGKLKYWIRKLSIGLRKRRSEQ